MSDEQADRPVQVGMATVPISGARYAGDKDDSGSLCVSDSAGGHSGQSSIYSTVTPERGVHDDNGRVVRVGADFVSACSIDVCT